MRVANPQAHAHQHSRRRQQQAVAHSPLPLASFQSLCCRLLLLHACAAPLSAVQSLTSCHHVSSKPDAIGVRGRAASRQRRAVSRESSPPIADSPLNLSPRLSRQSPATSAVTQLVCYRCSHSHASTATQPILVDRIRIARREQQPSCSLSRTAVHCCASFRGKRSIGVSSARGDP